MPKHKNKQHWNEQNPSRIQNPGVSNERSNRQNAYTCYQYQSQNFYNNYNSANYTQNATHYYDDIRFRPSYTQDYYRNNYFHANFQTNFTQDGGQSHFIQNDVRNFTQNARNTESNPKVQKISTQTTSYNDNNPIIQSNIMQNYTIMKKVTENSSETKLWYTNKKKGCKGNRMRKGNYLDKYHRDTSIFNEKGYIIKETLYRDPSLFYVKNISNTDTTSNDEYNDDWTDTFWLKQEHTSAMGAPETSQDTRNISRTKQNRLERTLNDMLAKPAEMSKGKSLLQKMGWQGGGLGRDGGGIVEPIAPKATYATKTIGLGHSTEKPEQHTEPKQPKIFAQLTHRKLKHPEFQNNFCINVLLYILDFVKNDEQNKIVFEPRLRKMERKRIHLIVEKIRECDNLDDLENFENFAYKQFELVKQIWVHNCYELWSESEGTNHNRRICLFKEAPAHVYLVTPENFTEDDESNDDIGNINKEIDSFTLSYENDQDNVFIPVDTKIVRRQDIKKEKLGFTDSQINKNNEKTHKNDDDTRYNEMTQEVKNNVDIKPKIEINGHIIIKSEHNDSNSISNKLSSNDEAIKENIHIIKKENYISNDIRDINICDEIKVKMEINEQNEENMSEKTTNSHIDNDIKPKTENIEQTVKKEYQVQSKESILTKIVKYFKEFSSDSTFTEFRFLGPFNVEEIGDINVFFDICMEQDEIKCDEKNELLAALRHDLVKFEVLEDNNGRRFVKKVEEHHPLQQPDGEDMVFCIE